MPSDQQQETMTVQEFCDAFVSNTNFRVAAQTLIDACDKKPKVETVALFVQTAYALLLYQRHGDGKLNISTIQKRRPTIFQYFESIVILSKKSPQPKNSPHVVLDRKKLIGEMRRLAHEATTSDLPYVKGLGDQLQGALPPQKTAKKRPKKSPAPQT